MNALPATARRLRVRLAWLALLAGVAAAAPAAERAGWDFDLATLEGDRFVQASQIAGPVLVNFWGRDCPPCVAELPRLQAFARDQRDWTLLLVATDPPQEARVFLQRRGITLPALKSGPNVVPLMRAAGNRTGGLPFTVALRDGHVCRIHEGELSDAALEDLRVSCGGAASGGSR